MAEKKDKIAKNNEILPPDERESVTIDLLEEFGILEENVAQELRQDQKPQSRLIDILRQDASLKSLKDLFTYEVASWPWKKRERLRTALEEEGLISLDMVQDQLGGLTGFDERLQRRLVEKNQISKQQADQAWDRSKEFGIPFWRALINMSLITPKELADFAQEFRSLQKQSPAESEFFEAVKKAGLLSEERLSALEADRIPRSELLDRLMFQEGVPFEEVAKVLREEFDIHSMRASDIEQQEDAAIYSIPDSFAQRHKSIPVEKSADSLKVAMTNPLQEGVLDQVRLVTGLEAIPVFISQRDFDELYERFYAERIRESNFLEDQDDAYLKDASAVQLVASIIEGGIKARASDIHFESQEGGLRVRYRIDGLLYDVTAIPQHQIGAILARIKIMAEMDITDKRHPQDGHFSIPQGDTRYDMRISTIPTYHGEKIVIRILDESNVIRGIPQLGLARREQQILEGLVHRPHGMILATGPMGSGKTTTLYAVLNELDILHQNIVTIENPVEYHLPGITQVQVHQETGLSFAAGLRALLRQDADVIMVGEIRDPDTAHVAIWAALTGHLVLSTLHTNDTAGAVTMLSNLNIQRYLISGALNGVLSSRLVRRLCRHCREEFEADDFFVNYHRLGHLEHRTFYRATGCKECNFIGYQGMTGVYEIMPISEEIRHAILDGIEEHELKQLAIDEGMRTLHENGLKKVLNGETTVDEIERKIMR